MLTVVDYTKYMYKSYKFRIYPTDEQKQLLAQMFGWSRFVTMLDYKTAREGKVLIKIDSFFPSSKICNNCKSKNDELNLSERE